MKKAIFVLACALSATFVSCSKGEYNSGDGQTGYNRFADVNNKPVATPTGKFTAKLNDADFSAAYSNAYYLDLDMPKAITIVGYKSSFSAADGFTIGIEDHKVGTYTVNLASATPTSAVYVATGTTTALVMETGTVEITESNENTIKGKFELYASGFKAVEGSFDVPIITKIK